MTGTFWESQDVLSKNKNKIIGDILYSNVGFYRIQIIFLTNFHLTIR